MALVSGGILGHYPTKVDKSDHTSHQKVDTNREVWRWEHGGVEPFTSTQHGDTSYSIYLLSHMHCEAEMNLTGLQE